jgi:hypothetical protein
MNLNPRASTFCKGLGECIRDLTFGQKEILEGDCSFGGTDRCEHRGKDLVAILQERDFISLEQGWPEHVSHGSDEGIIARLIIGHYATPNLLFRREIIA